MVGQKIGGEAYICPTHDIYIIRTRRFYGDIIAPKPLLIGGD
jgi:hypothetical protein